MTAAKPMPEWTVDDVQRLISRVEIDDNGCWVIDVGDRDYPIFKKDLKAYMAHRVSYSMFVGDPGIELVVDHQCPSGPNKHCVNPKHLRLVTSKQNIRNAYPTCKAGHPFTNPNVYEKNGKRRCVACTLANSIKTKPSAAKLRPGMICDNGHCLATNKDVYEYGTTVLCAECQREKARASYEARKLPSMTSDQIRRFHKFIKRVESGCWEWQGALSRGYGRYTLSSDSEGQDVAGVYTAHRIAYQLERGAISRDWTIDHLCNNKRCCNPDHLEPVTRGENNKRAAKRTPQIMRRPGRFHRTRRTSEASKRRQAPKFAPPEGHYRLKDLAPIVGANEKQLHRWIQKRGLPYYKRNNNLYVDIEAFRAWQKEHPAMFATTATPSQQTLFAEVDR